MLFANRPSAEVSSLEGLTAGDWKAEFGESNRLKEGGGLLVIALRFSMAIRQPM